MFSLPLSLPVNSCARALHKFKGLHPFQVHSLPLSLTMNCSLVFLFSLAYCCISSVSCADDFTDDEYKAIFCTKKMKSIATMTFSPITCMAEAMGAVLDEKKVKIPKRVTDRFTASVAKYSVIGDVDKFSTWMCKDVKSNMKIIKQSYTKNPNLNKKESEVYSDCLVEDVAATIEEEICEKKSPIGKQVESERVKCMKTFAPAKACAKEMMSGQSIDTVKIDSWICAKEENAEGYVSAEMVCYIGNKDIGKKYLQCLNTAVKKLLKK